MKTPGKKTVPAPPSLAVIRRALRDEYPELRREYGLKSLGVFGSFVRGEQKKGSDLDLLAEFERVPSLFQLIRLEGRLSDRLGVKVDLVMKSALRRRIGRLINEEVQRI